MDSRSQYICSLGIGVFILILSVVMLTAIPYPYMGVIQSRFREGGESFFRVSYTSSQETYECKVKVSTTDYEMYRLGTDYRVYASLWNLHSCQTVDQDANYVITFAIGMGIAVFGVCSGIVVVCLCSVKLCRPQAFSRQVHPDPIIASKTEVLPETTVEIGTT